MDVHPKGIAFDRNHILVQDDDGFIERQIEKALGADQADILRRAATNEDQLTVSRHPQ